MERVIDKLLREVATGTDGIQFFGHGPKAYASLEGSDYPRIWVYDTLPVDTVYKNGLIETKYQVVMEITTLSRLDSGAEHALENCLAVVDPIWKKFIHRLSRDPRLMEPINTVRRLEIWNANADGVGGYVCSFTVKPKDTPELQCL